MDNKINVVNNLPDSVKDISYTDLNKLLKTGNYYGSHLKHAPNGSDDFFNISVTKHTNDWIVQEAILSDQNIYLRAIQGGIWYDWELVHFNNNESSKTVTVKIVETAISHPLASEVSNGYMSSEDKYKLDRIEPNANNYVHPTYHSPDIIQQDPDNRFVTDEQIKDWNSKAAGNHIHKDYLSKFDLINATLDSLGKTIVNMSQDYTLLKDRVDKLTRVVEDHVENIK